MEKEKFITKGFVKDYALDKFLKGEWDEIDLQKEDDMEVKSPTLRKNFVRVEILPTRKRKNVFILDKEYLKNDSSIKSYNKEEIKSIKNKKYFLRAEIRKNP